MKKISALAAILIFLTAMVSGCSSESASMVLEIENEKQAVIQIENADSDNQVFSGALTVEADEELVIDADMDEASDVLIEYISGEAAIDGEVPEDAPATYETTHQGSGVMTITMDPGEYSLRVTPQFKSNGTITITVQKQQ